MANSPRRIYIYPPLQQDDGITANRYWPPGISKLSDDQLPFTSSGYSGSYPDEGGGLLGMLLRAMPQNRDQPDVDSGLASDGAPEVQYANYDSLQGGLLGSRAAPQAEQSRYQPFAQGDELPLSDPRNPNFRQLARIRVAGRQPREIAPDGLANYLSQSSGATSQASAPNTSAPAIRLASSNSNLSPEPQSPPALANGLAAVAGVDPQNPMQTASRTSGGVLGVHSGQWAPPGITTAPTIKTAQLVLPGIGIPLPPPMRPVSPPSIPMPTIPDSWKTAGAFLQLYPRFLFGMGGGGAAALSGGATILNQRKPPAPGSRKGGGPNDRDEEDDPAPMDDQDWHKKFLEANRKRIAAAARERGKAVGKNSIRFGNDLGDYCSDRHQTEMDNCAKRYRNQEYADWGYLGGCEERASARRDKCNKGDLNPEGLNEWGLDDEETYNRDFLHWKLP